MRRAARGMRGVCTPCISFARRAREAHPMLWVVAALFVVYFGIEWVEQVTGVK